jgi:HSP20 family molecular chaperone IbpA
MNITLVPKYDYSNVNGLTGTAGLVGSTHMDYDPFSIIDRWTNKWPSLFNTFDAVSTSYSYATPWKINKQDKDTFQTELELPRFKKENINISVENDVLHISAEQDSLKFYHSVSVPSEIDPESISAKLDHGVLYVTAKRSESAKPKKITIQTV